MTLSRTPHQHFKRKRVALASIPALALACSLVIFGGDAEIAQEHRPVVEVAADTRTKIIPIPQAAAVTHPLSETPRDIPREEKKNADELRQKKANAESHHHARDNEELDPVARNFQAWAQHLVDLEISISDPEIVIDQKKIDYIMTKISMYGETLTSLTPGQKDLALKALRSLEKILIRIDGHVSTPQLLLLEKELRDTLNRCILWGVILDEQERDSRFLSLIPDPKAPIRAELNRILQTLQSGDYSEEDMNELQRWITNGDPELLPPDWYARTLHILERSNVPGNAKFDVAKSLRETLEALKTKKESLLQEYAASTDVVKRQKLLKEIEKSPDITDEMIKRASKIEADLGVYRTVNYISGLLDSDRAMNARSDERSDLDKVPFSTLLNDLKQSLPVEEFSDYMKNLLLKVEGKITSEEESVRIINQWMDLKESVLSVYPEGEFPE